MILHWIDSQSIETFYSYHSGVKKIFLGVKNQELKQNLEKMKPGILFRMRSRNNSKT